MAKPKKGFLSTGHTLADLLIAVAVVYLAVCGYLYTAQRQFIYFPDIRTPVRAAHDGAALLTRDIEVPTPDGLTLKAWYEPPTKVGKGVVVLFHGNGGHRGIRAFKAQPFIAAGYGFLLSEYRGYGENAGKPTERGLYDDARGYMNWLIREQGIAEDHIILYGESLGTGVAVQIAVEYPGVKAVILETPFSSLTDVAQMRFPIIPVGLLMKDKFNSHAKIGGSNVPILVLLAGHDMIVPPRFGQKLFEKANEPKRMEIYPEGGHNNLYKFGALNDAVGFLEKL